MGERIGAEEVIQRGIYGSLYTSRESLYKACQAGRIPHIKFGNRLLFDVDDLEKDIEARKVEARRR